MYFEKKQLETFEQDKYRMRNKSRNDVLLKSQSALHNLISCSTSTCTYSSHKILKNFIALCDKTFQTYSNTCNAPQDEN
ncbi:CLUMA_CG003313, isoform A [Clunio marinus]|uniref:CLUMA_CG003313, isoform A n=1 Tax=Clunio marinus TaxID=568069 RepID=A0A1J1HNC7_9DIPT|nr:CLUMA_CG003313, isoform A [Clunio marinus]